VAELFPTQMHQGVATENIVHIDLVNFFATTIVRSQYENYRPPRPDQAARSTPKRRPPIAPEVRELIRTMSRDIIGWGGPRVEGKLQLLGNHVSQTAGAKYMVHHPILSARRRPAS
jgi:hypothetical protein